MKPSLSYFPHSTNTFFERSIRKLLLEHQANGYLLYNYLKTEIFKVNGYYLNYDELLHDDISDWFKFLSKESVGKILTSLLDIGLFDKQIFADQKILTSASIQEDFVDIMKGMRRQYYINPEIRLLEYDYYESSLRIKEKDENFMKTSENFVKLPQTQNNSSENFKRITQTSEGFQKLENSSEDFVFNTEASQKIDTNYLERKEVKEIKKLKIDNLSFSLEETEKLLEIFIMEKNYPKEEFEKFLNHYGRTGWIDKNGNKITDAEATARNWTQLNTPIKYHVALEYHKLWKEVWFLYCEKLGFEKAKHLLHVKPSINSNTIIFNCSDKDRTICEENIEFLKPELRKVFGQEIKLEYRVPNMKHQKVIA